MRFEPRKGNVRRAIGWLNLGRDTNLPSSEESRERNARQRRRVTLRTTTRRRRAHGRQRR